MTTKNFMQNSHSPAHYTYNANGALSNQINFTMNKLLFIVFCFFFMISCHDRNSYQLQLDDTSGYLIEKTGDKLLLRRSSEPVEYSDVWYLKNNRYYDDRGMLTMALINDTAFEIKDPKSIWYYYKIRIYKKTDNVFVYESYKCFTNSINAVLDFAVYYDSTYTIKKVEYNSLYSFRASHE